ncbi:SGNH/GDSL hydrolase family protein [Massiliimalia timonensis]|uniref:SGNH/GDSL hydrolase family protein n=1 Tax=Massiliimalia timonensis TaxID=1987501 RepID=UPI00189C5A5A|nr:SGNH/GDSL hydrolase family protein [Massiliimalia timonensis]
MKIENNSSLTFLFFGDSIIDCCRNRHDGNDLGTGFVFLLASELSYRHPECYMKFLNRGIGGNTVQDLLERINKDCLNLSPDVLTILVGLNDSTFRNWDDKDGIPVTKDRFEKQYRQMLQLIRSALPKTEIILMTPYLYPITDEHRLNQMYLKQYVPIIENLAKEFQCRIVPLYQEMETQFNQGKGPLYTKDGVHPTPAGAYFIAGCWKKYALGE